MGTWLYFHNLPGCIERNYHMVWAIARPVWSVSLKRDLGERNHVWVWLMWTQKNISMADVNLAWPIWTTFYTLTTNLDDAGNIRPMWTTWMADMNVPRLLMPDVNCGNFQWPMWTTYSTHCMPEKNMTGVNPKKNRVKPIWIHIGETRS